MEGTYVFQKHRRGKSRILFAPRRRRRRGRGDRPAPRLLHLRDARDAADRVDVAVVDVDRIDTDLVVADVSVAQEAPTIPIRPGKNATERHG